MQYHGGGPGTATNAASVTDGATNTTEIVDCLTNGTGCTGGGGLTPDAYAAGICSTYAPSGGYTTGWFLPAKDQLSCLYPNRNTIGGFEFGFYWSSTEISADGVWLVNFNFNTGNAVPHNKNDANIVRCIRGYTP